MTKIYSRIMPYSNLHLLPQTSGGGQGLWSEMGCWRHGGVLAGPYLTPPHHFHFLFPLLMTHSEPGGQRSQGPKCPPDSEKVWNRRGGAQASTWTDEGWTRSERTWRNKNKEMEREWMWWDVKKNGKRASVEKQRKKRENKLGDVNKFVKHLLNNFCFCKT